MPQADRKNRATYNAAYYAANRDRIRKQQQARRDGSTETREPSRTARLRLRVVEGYGGACACCGTTYLPHLTIDHVHEDGAEDRARASKDTIMRRIVREGFPPPYQVLCFNCNYAKHLLGRCGCSGVALAVVA